MSDYFFDKKLFVGVHDYVFADDYVFAKVGNGFEIIVGDVNIFRKGRERRTGLFASCFPCFFQSVYTTSLIRNLP